jgi:hypothetical protein
MREKLGANLPLFWNNDGKDRPKGQICPLAKKEVFITIDPLASSSSAKGYLTVLYTPCIQGSTR